MSEKSIKLKIPLITKPIVKKRSIFVGGSLQGPKKMTPNKDAYKRQ